MIFDGHVHQLPDIDPVETGEWLDSLDALVDTLEDSLGTVEPTVAVGWRF